MSCHVMSYYVLSTVNVMSCHVILCYVILCLYAIVCYVCMYDMSNDNLQTCIHLMFISNAFNIAVLQCSCVHLHHM